ncbi:MAG: nucleotidyltransferase domain-containing protein [Caldilineaceae bacterium]
MRNRATGSGKIDMKSDTAQIRSPQEVWPGGGSPLVEGVHSFAFMTVTKEILDKIVERIVSTLSPEKIILFGSYAYGDPNSDSDVDLLIIQQTDKRPAQRSVAVSKLIRPRPFPVDILVKTPQEIQQALQNGNYFIREILERGKILYERLSG